MHDGYDSKTCNLFIKIKKCLIYFSIFTPDFFIFIPEHIG